MRYVALGAAALVFAACADHRPHVIFETELGQLEIEVYVDKAPVSGKDFLTYVDAGHYDGQGFYRTVREDNDPRGMGMSLIQGGRLDGEPLTPPIAHEPTSETGLSNRSGSISIARGDPGTGSAAFFFINIGDNTFLDFGGSRNPDGQGYAAFGQVVKGMDVARAIQAREAKGESDLPVTQNQYLTHPVIITKAYRK